MDMRQGRETAGISVRALDDTSPSFASGHRVTGDNSIEGLGRARPCIPNMDCIAEWGFSTVGQRVIYNPYTNSIGECESTVGKV